jgi:amino acid transporter
MSLYVSQAVSVAFYMIAFAEAFRPLFPLAENIVGVAIDPRIISIPATALLIFVILRKGADIGVKALWIVVAVLILALGMFFAGAASQTAGGVASVTAHIPQPDSFTKVFAICFPAFTGIAAGVGLSGDLRDPRRAIPVGTLTATIVGMLVYVVVSIGLYMSAAPDVLGSDPLVMSRIATWGPIIPIGLAAATLSSAVGSLIVAPRTLQALANDRVFPAGWLNGILGKGRGRVNEPVAATMVTGVIAFVFVVIGGVDFVAQIISMFFMVTYGALCSISFLEHFSGNPSYRPSFRSPWYVSLVGAVLCVFMMFQMQPFYATLAVVTMVGIYGLVGYANPEGRGLAEVFQGVMFQLTRWLQIVLQSYRNTESLRDWRPSFVAISKNTLTRIAPFELLKWISYRYGFGMFVHYIPGMLSAKEVAESKEVLGHLIEQAAASGGGVFVDTMISPSFTTALAQVIQLPGVSGMDNNSVLFEFSPSHEEDLSDIVSGCRMAADIGFNTCVLRSSERHLGYKGRLDVWLNRYDTANANLMILLAYVVMGHPEWKKAQINIYVTFPSDTLDEQVAELHERIAAGRIPISARNVRPLPADGYVAFEELVAQHSAEADLVIVGYTQDYLDEIGQSVFFRFEEAKDVLFVSANQEVVIS